MRIIDLLNKIANGEEVPKRIKYDEITWEIDYAIGDYFRHINCTSEWLCEKYTKKRSIRGFLNDTVEIPEEENKIEKLENGKWHIEGKDGKLIMLKDKIDELIDEVNKLKEDK